MLKPLTIAHTVILEVIRRKDIYVLAILIVFTMLLLMSLNIFGLGGKVEYTKDVGLMIAWLVSWVLCVAHSSRQLPQEEARGTIFTLLARPITRLELIIGKWLGTWIVVALAASIFYAVIIALVLLRGGRMDPTTMIQGIILHSGSLAAVAAIGLALSTRMNEDAAITMTFLLTGCAYGLAPRIPQLIINESGLTADALLALYYALPHFELFDMRLRIVHDKGPALWSTVGIAMIYAALLCAFFLALAWLGYRHKLFNRENRV